MSAKTKKILYRVVTGFLAFGMLSNAFAQLFYTQGFVTILTHLGYPLYLLTILGIRKILGVIALLVPRFPLVKEWAYAGFFFAMSGAFVSHLAVGDGLTDVLPALVLLILVVFSWYLRPADRRLI